MYTGMQGAKMILRRLKPNNIEIAKEKIKDSEFYDSYALIDFHYERVVKLDGFFEYEDLKMIVDAMENFKG